MAREPLVIGPFSGGLNAYDDPTAVRDVELVECLNWDPGLEGSLRSRPPFSNLNKPMPLGLTGDAKILGFFYGPDGDYYLIASDGLSSTWVFDGQIQSWALITNTFAASAMAQFDNRAWLASPVGEADPGGYWTPTGGFVSDANMPRGDTLVAFKSRLWISPGKGNPNGTRLYYSKVLGQPDFWLAAAFVDVGQGDGQDIVLLTTYYNTLVAFRTQSIYAFSFNADPAQGAVALLVPGVGLTSKECLIAYENYLYFMYDEKAYQFVNNNAQQINLKVPFTATNQANNSLPFSVSLFNNRAIFHYYDTMYVYSLRTKTWTRWKSPHYGSIGQIMSPAGVLTDEAYVNPSTAVPPVLVTRENLFEDPDLTSLSYITNAPTQSTNVLTADGVRWDLITAAAVGINLTNSAVPTGDESRLRVRVRSNRPLSATPRLRGTNVISGPVTIDINWAWIDVTGVAGGSSLNGFLLPAGAGHTTGDWIEISHALIAVGTDTGDWFSGDTPDTDYFSNAWLGATNASVSQQTPLRVSSLLYIEDAVTNAAEAFTCEIQTKNYNYQLSSNFKRLFWWGVDAVFRTRIRGWAVPVVQNAQVTWGQLYSQGITWGDLLGGTWGSPFLGSVTVSSDYDLGGTGPVRKFIKMFKSMRFRQIYFRVIFDTDGSIGTAPVNLFTITAYVGSKETVSKTVS